MRYPLRTIPFLAMALALVPAAHAQPRPRVAIEFVRIGFPAGIDSTDPADVAQGQGTLFKSGFWTPVFVTLRAGPDGATKPGRIVVEGTDSDDVQNTYAVPVPALEPNDTVTVQAFTKTGSAAGELVIRLDEQVAENRFKTAIELKKSFTAIGVGEPLLLAVGSRIPGLRQNLAGLFPANANQDRLRVAYADDIGYLPNRWFGYAPVDLLLLTTGKREFVNSLLGEERHYKEALAEWVRRGGHLVVSCGRNQDSVPDLFNRANMPLPVKFSDPLQVRSVEGLRGWLTVGTPALQAPRDGGTLLLANLKPKEGMPLETMVPERPGEDSPPLVVRWPYGLGQITLVAFDLDQPPFTTWNGQKDFWQRLLAKLGMRPPKEPKADGNGGQAGFSPTGRDTSTDLASLLQSKLENFKDVSVISFGWVALFILIYIIIVGPLDYLFLKKVVKRLELTWITFPTVVVVVSAVAYFAAYSLKGNDLRINKVDLVDIDLGSRQVFGNSWFTVFSPRIQLYTVGVEPASPLFAAEDPSAVPKPAPVVVSWMGKPDEGYGGYNRARSQSLFHRTYRYEPDATGLREVPIQVWSSKSFTANWEGSLPRDFPRPEPPERGGLAYQESPRKLQGQVTNPLPIPLEDVALIYGEGAPVAVAIYPLDKLGPGESKPIKEAKTGNMTSWRGSLPVYYQNNYGQYQNLPNVPGAPLMKQIMFYSAVSDENQNRDSALGYLDQTWRQNLKDVAVLYGRVATQDGPAEEVTQSAATPTRLWLGQLPGPGEKRPRLDGMLIQETYVRVYIPVPPAPAKDGGK